MKKMRRMIPALCMLLVSAIMLSTASYAWFTMNTEVTASGMQIQAQADSSLVIGTAPLKSSDKAPKVEFNTGIQDLRPVTMNPVTETKEEDGVTVTNTTGYVWQTINGKPDEFTGRITNPTYTTVDTASAYYIQEVLYIASAGDAITTTDNKTFKITLTAPVALANEVAHKAYSVAVYFVEQNDDYSYDNVGVGDIPAAILHVDDVNSRNTFTLPAAVEIPSVQGVVNNAVGLKVVLRFFVDGDLQAIEVDNTEGGEGWKASTKNREDVTYTLVTDTKYTSVAGNTNTKEVTTGEGESATKETVTFRAYNSAYSYYTPIYDGADSAKIVGYAPAQVGEYNNGDEIPDTWYFKDVKTTPVEYNYINSSQVPTAAATVKVAFELIAR